MHEPIELSDRQLNILEFLELVGPSEEGDVAYSIQISPHELLRVPPKFSDLPGEYIARRELERLKEAGLVTYDGVVWAITPAAKRLLNE